MKLINRKKFFLNIIIPTLLTEGLFIALIFAFIIPYFNHNMIEAKKEMIKEIINSTLCIAENYYNEAAKGNITDEEARKRAINTIASIRYGTENKDYIWITDDTPNMIMHPYRKELNGRNVQNFSDPNGKKLFSEMVREVKENGEGFVDYMWQWMDDSTKIVPKISYIKEFKSWNWIIGTGVYIEDVKESISLVINSLFLISLGIFALISFMLLLIAKQNIRTEKERNLAELSLKESNEKYKALVEASGDGTLLFLNNKCIFKNNKISEIIEDEIIENLSPDLKSIISQPLKEDQKKIIDFLKRNGEFLVLETQIVNKNKININVLVSFSKVSLFQSEALIVIIKDLSYNADDPALKLLFSDIFSNIALNLGIGIFRALPGRKGRIIEANQPFLKLIGYDSVEEISSIFIYNIFNDLTEKKEFISGLLNKGIIKDFNCSIINKNGKLSYLSISAITVKNPEGEIEHIDGFITDRSALLKEEFKNQEIVSDLIAKYNLKNLEISNLALNELPECQYDSTVINALRIMNFYSIDFLRVMDGNINVSFILSKNKIFNNLLDKNILPEDKITPDLFLDVKFIEAESTVMDCILLMIKTQNDFVFVIRNEKIKILYLRELLFILTGREDIFVEKLSKLEKLDELKRVHELLPNLIKYNTNIGTEISIITSTITKVSDIITEKIIANALKILGKPPCNFAFIALGSEGRAEQGLITDQDNAIIFDDIEVSETEIVQNYFIRLAKIINNHLDEAGYTLCKGEIMASNKKWNQPLGKWKNYFYNWITVPEPQSLIDSSIFFDFRIIFGDRKLTDGLREYINSSIKVNPNFLLQIALLTINYKLPLGMFGKIQTEATDDNTETFDLKNSIRLLVNIIRLYAMKYQINETNTLSRLNILYGGNHISKTFHNEISFCFKYLMNLQIKYQAENFYEGISGNDHIDISLFTPSELSVLKSVLSGISSFQSKVKFDFGITT